MLCLRYLASAIFKAIINKDGDTVEFFMSCLCREQSERKDKNYETAFFVIVGF